MLSIAKHQGKHSDSTLIFQKTTHFAMLLFLYCPPVPSFSLCSLTKCPYSALFPRLCLRWLSSQRLLAISSAALCSYFTSNHLHYSRSLTTHKQVSVLHAHTCTLCPAPSSHSPAPSLEMVTNTFVAHHCFSY